MKKVVFFILIAILFYTRFVNLSWGLPYPMHPDERNMAVAVQQLSCPPLSSFITTHQTLTTCLNPHFFAYGQFPLYLAYGGIQIYYFITGINGQPTFIESTLALRTISALSSILLVFILLKISKLLFPKKKVSSFGFEFLALCIFIFQPYAIQFSHFGTTESLLMLLYSLIIYLSLKLLTTNFQLQTVCFLGLFSGLALGTKTSSVLFLGVPFIIFFIKIIGGSHGRASDSAHLAVKRGALAGWKMTDRIYCFYHLCIYSIILIFFFFLSSPQSFLNWTDFMSSMNYESGVGLGTYLPFYTRQFVGTIPVLFQFQNILPYALGWPTLIGGVLGFFLLPSGFYDFLRKVAVAGGFPTRADSRASREHWRDGKQLTESSALFDILRIALLLSFLPPSFFFAKWTRFIAPSFPLFSLFAFLFIIQIAEKYIKNIFFITIITVVTSIPGYSFLSVYTSPDVRFTASEWIYKNIPANSKILTETANVIDLPIPSANYELPTTNYQINSFNFYDLDTNHQLQMELSQALKGVDYIIIPSRRIFKNHPKNIYPQVAAYYEKLFSGTLGFEKVAEFSSYPRLEFQVLSFKFKNSIIDENAEETWTVFDHPVIRIYKRSQKPEDTSQKPIQNILDFSGYKTIDYELRSTNYKLLVADTTEKWEKGLMFVKNRGDIGGLDGMIFKFPDSQILSFWNKNTLSNLTLYWIQNNKVMGTTNMPSITDSGVIQTFSSPVAVDTVVEMIK